MPRASSLKRLPMPILLSVQDAIKRGCTVDQITTLLEELGHERSRSAVGRYAKGYSQFADHQRDLKIVAETFGREFGEDDDPQVRLLIQMMTSISTRAVMKIASDDEMDITAKEIAFFTRGVKDLVSAARMNFDRELKIREEEAKRMRDLAIAAVEDEGRRAGASEEHLNLIKRRLLGLS